MIFLLSASALTQSSIDTASIFKQIRTVLDDQCKAWNSGDIEGYMKGYWHSDSLLFTSGGNIELGWKSTLEKYKKSYDSRLKMGILNFSNLRFSLLSENAAWVLGSWKLKRDLDEPKGIFTLITTLESISSLWHPIVFRHSTL
jgi:hypothetical protein